MTHIIRLRGAWEITSSSGTTLHSRKFGRPRTLEAHERVWLVCDDVPGPNEVSLNGKDIGDSSEKGPFAIDITDVLEPRNQILFSVDSSDPLGEVTLEIRANSLPNQG
jgi:hypothetical protein